MSDACASSLCLRIFAKLSEKGRIDAFRQGVRVDEAIYELHDHDSLWERAVALGPRIVSSDEARVRYDAELPIHRHWCIELVRDAYTDASTDQLFGYRKAPSVDVVWGDQVPLDHYPSNTDEALALEESRRAQIEAERGSMADELAAARRTWNGERAKWIEEWRELLAVEMPWRAYKAAVQAARRAVDDFEAQDPSSPGVNEALESAVKAINSVEALAEEQEKRRRTTSEREALLQEATDWVLEHGSPRLQKAFEAGLIDTCLGVYRDERLRLEHSGWKWLDDFDKRRLTGIINPGEVLLDLLLESRQWDPKARLAFLRNPTGRGGRGVVVARFLDREIYTYEPPEPPEYDNDEEPF